MKAQHISVEDVRGIIDAVGVPLVRDEELSGGTAPELLLARLRELVEAYAGWCFDEAQCSDLEVARAALDVERKALKLLSAIGSRPDGEVSIRRELGPGQMHSFAFVEGGGTPSRNLEEAVRGVQKLVAWAVLTRERAENGIKRLSERTALADQMRSRPMDAPALFDAWSAEWAAVDEGGELPAPLVTTVRRSPDDRLLWLLAKIYYELWKRRPGYSTPDASQEEQGRGGPFIRYLETAMPLFGINISPEGYRQRWARLVERERDEADWRTHLNL
jgi:hypothetical protein